MTHYRWLLAGGCALVILASGCSGDDPDDKTTSSTARIQTTQGDLPLLFEQAGPVEAGTYVIDKFGTPLQVTVPAGWSTFGDFAVTAPDGFQMGYLGFWDVEDVHLDACHRGHRALVGPSVSELVSGLVGQGGMDATEPEPTELDGHAGQSLNVSPSDVDPATCDEGVVLSWFESDGDARFYDAPTEAETVHIVDIDGRRALINVGSVVEMPPDVRAQLDDMLASIRIG